MAWSSSSRKKRFNKGWAKIRLRVLQRDGYQCQWPCFDENGFYRGICGAPANEVDHVQRDNVHDDDRLANLRALCHRHHALKTQGESVSARYERRKSSNNRKFFSHPAFR